MPVPRIDPGWRAAACALAWLAGIAVQLQQSALWPGPVYVWAGAAALALGLAAWRLRDRAACTLLLVAALALAAFASTGWRAGQRLDDRLSRALEGADLIVEGIVDAMPQVSIDGTRFVFAVQRATRDGTAVTVPELLSLGWYPGWYDDAQLAGPPIDVRAGQRWALPVRLKQPHGPMNPHGFDTELWLFERGIGATGSVRVTPGGVAPQLLEAQAGRPIERLRQSVRDAVILRVADARIGGVLAALAVGDQAAIERADWELFRQTGVAHLMSISGLHVTMFAWLAGLACGWLWRRSARLCLWLPAPIAARALGVAVAALYALVAGWGVPAQRTLLMLACAVALRNAGWFWPWPLTLLAAGVGVTLLDPWALLQAGFWLSFAAVGLLLASEPAAGGGVPQGWRERTLALLRSQAIATVGLAPLAMVFFQQVSVVGFVANLLAIPWITLVVTPLALLGAAFAPLWGLAGLAMQALLAVLQPLAAWPGANWSAAAAPAWAVVAGLLAGAAALLPLPWRVRMLAAPLALPLLWPVVERPPSGQFELVAVDIEQGTSVLVRTRQHLLVYDAGPAYARDSDAGQRLVAPLLRARGEPRIDLLMLSHRDSDHVGGAASLQAALPVLRWSSSLDESHPLRALAREHEVCAAGQSWTWDGVRFEVLHPLPAAADRKSNALSCVLRVAAADGTTALLTGDIEAAQEAALVQRAPERLRAQLLLVPHHGSRTSSSEAFLDAVQPRVAIVQAGYRSRFGHPNPDVLARYDARGIDVVRSDRCGAWIWAQGQAACTRELRRRYWHWGSTQAGADVAVPAPAAERRP
ncbi:MAG: DNA internalization-related competence protein ComEC/Rec2 [Burkholderiaceae bacterium]